MVLKFEAQLTAYDIEEDREMLLCCTEASSFTTLYTGLTANEDLTYEELTAILNEIFSGTKGMNINIFSTDLKICVK